MVGAPVVLCKLVGDGARRSGDSRAHGQHRHPGLSGALTSPSPWVSGGEDEPDLAEAVALRLAGYAEIEAQRRRELRAVTEEESALMADDLLQLLPLLAAEPDRGSGLVEQQRWFSLIRQRRAPPP